MNDNENSRDEMGEHVNEPESAQNKENEEIEKTDGNEEQLLPEGITEDGEAAAPEHEIPEEAGIESANDENESESKDESDKPSDFSVQKISNNRGLWTAGIMLSAIAVIITIVLSTCLIIGLAGNIGKVAFVPVVGVPYYSENDESEVIASVKESIVVITVDSEVSGGTGSGIILSANGYIVTNYHVVEGAKSIYVQLYGSSNNIRAELIGYSKHDDIAVIKVSKTGLRPATFVADCSTCKPGQKVYAIGSPKGTDYSYSVTTGIISAVNRQVKLYDGTTLKKKMRMIQTDAAVNPGNSGGALINAAGQVVGIVTMKLDGVDGMGFALPSDGVIPIVNAIIESGNANGIKSTISSGRPLVGVTCVSVQKDIWYTRTEFGIAQATDELVQSNPDLVFKSDEDGVYVQSTTEGMDAHGKLFPGDVITKIGNVRVYTAEQLISVLNNHNGGDTITLTVYRGGEYVKVSITLKESPIE